LWVYYFLFKCWFSHNKVFNFIQMPIMKKANKSDA
jgi:hypothetical protein